MPAEDMLADQFHMDDIFPNFSTQLNCPEGSEGKARVAPKVRDAQALRVDDINKTGCLEKAAKLGCHRYKSCTLGNMKGQACINRLALCESAC